MRKTPRRRRRGVAEANAGPKRPAREPRAFARRAGERRGDAARIRAAASPRTTSPARAPGCAARKRLQPIGADAAGERRDAVVGDDHAAVAAGERQHRQQVGGDRGAAKVRLEGEQVASRARVSRRACALGRQRLPRAVRGDDEAGAELDVARPRAGDRSDRQRRSRRRGRRSTAAPHGCKRVAPAASAASASSVSRCSRPIARPQRCAPSPRRQRGDDRLVAAHQGDATQLGAGARVDLGADAERVEQREVARGDALAADLAARKRLPLDQRDRPAGAREQDRRARAGRAGADDGDVERVVMTPRRRRAATRSSA